MASLSQNVILAFTVILLCAPLALSQFPFFQPYGGYGGSYGGSIDPDQPINSDYIPQPEVEPQYQTDPEDAKAQQEAAGNPLLLPVPIRTQKVNWTGVVIPPSKTLGFAGSWEIISNNSGVNCMHLAIARHNKAIMIDTIALGKSLLKLPEGKCRVTPNVTDCYAHSAEFDYDTGKIRELKIESDTWCSSGGFAPDGTLVQTGGYNEGDRSVRYLKPCPTCDWDDYSNALYKGRWYGTQVTLADGSPLVLGARRGFSIETVPEPGSSNSAAIPFRFFQETTDNVAENNLYPFVHLSPDGNVFIFANDRAVIFDPKTNKIVRELPSLKDGVSCRNYPPSGMSAILPIDLRKTTAGQPIDAEVIVCGGGTKTCFVEDAPNGRFPNALDDCYRISLTNPAAKWVKEVMPVGRTMSDFLILPTGDLLIINGARRGCSGWLFGKDPVLTPFLYNPREKLGNRWKTLVATTIARMYHSTSAVLPDATIMVAGGNANQKYDFRDTTEFPTEMRIERFIPPYLDPKQSQNRPVISDGSITGGMRYGEKFTFEFSTPKSQVNQADVMVTMYAPPYTTHGFSMNQRLVILNIEAYKQGTSTEVTVTAPPNGNIAPAGYYYLFVVAGGVPSKAAWVQIL
ncbi:hypothetical protein LUZ60_008187 [Juncus effusus]|nr:hypothetical protein LUZ60_008187 [Juncus effusus]